MKTAISNPPYNMKWEIPPFARLEKRFENTEIPPESNANYVFLLTALDECDRCVFLLPCGILTSKNKNEFAIRKYLIEHNYVESVIMLSGKMFENTGVATCVIILDKNKQTTNIELIDASEKLDTEIRKQKGQFGGKAHENRTYNKIVKVISDELINDVIQCIKEQKTINNYCANVSINQVREKDYSLSAGMYFNVEIEIPKHRPYEDIVNDLNRVIREKNSCKLTINETLAKNIGFDVDLYKQKPLESEEFQKLFNKIVDIKIEKENYFVATKNKNEIKFENGSKDSVSSILMMIFQMWKQHVYYLNQEENRLLIELRDALIPEIMSGEIEL